MENVNGTWIMRGLAWDDPYYDYAGYKVEGDHIVSVPMSEADEFYFAILEEIPEGRKQMMIMLMIWICSQNGCLNTKRMKSR